MIFKRKKQVHSDSVTCQQPHTYWNKCQSGHLSASSPVTEAVLDHGEESVSAAQRRQGPRAPYNTLHGDSGKYHHILVKKMKRKIQIISWYYYENSFPLVNSLKESLGSSDHTLKSTAFCHGCPSVVPKSEVSTSPGNLSEIKILRLHLKPTA